MHERRRRAAGSAAALATAKRAQLGEAALDARRCRPPPPSSSTCRRRGPQLELRRAHALPVVERPREGRAEVHASRGSRSAPGTPFQTSSVTPCVQVRDTPSRSGWAARSARARAAGSRSRPPCRWRRRSRPGSRRARSAGPSLVSASPWPRKMRRPVAPLSATWMLPAVSRSARGAHGRRRDRGRAAGHVARAVWKFASPDWIESATRAAARAGSASSPRS